jgi:hypothetical protein
MKGYNWIELFQTTLNVSFQLPQIVLCCLSLELLSVQSAEENNFITKYSPQVWKGNIHVWLGMYYDSDGKYF